MTWSAPVTFDLETALAEFHAALPGWWITLGECSVSCHASCGPDVDGRDKLLLKWRGYDDGFHVDLPQPTSFASAVRAVTALANKGFTS